MKRTLLRMALVAGSLLAVAIPASANQATFSSIDNAIKGDGGTAQQAATIGNQAIKKIEGVGEILKVDIGDGSGSIIATDKAVGLQTRGSDEHLLKQPDISKSLGVNTRPIGGDDRTAKLRETPTPFGSSKTDQRGRIDQASLLPPASITAMNIGAIDLPQADQQSGALTNIT